MEPRASICWKKSWSVTELGAFKVKGQLQHTTVKAGSKVQKQARGILNCNLLFTSSHIQPSQCAAEIQYISVCKVKES